MKSPESLLMEKYANSYLDYIRNEAEECINRRMAYVVHDCDHETKSLTLCFETKDWMMNPAGVLHGGMMSTMFDITMGITSRVVSHYFTPTVNLSVSFLAPAPNNDKLYITARATRIGKTFIHLVAEARSEKADTICATATGIFFCDKSRRLDL